MTEPDSSTRRRAELEFGRRMLADDLESIADQRLKELAKKLVDGKANARELAHYVDHSSAGSNALDRFVSGWQALTPEEREQLASTAETEIARIAAAEQPAAEQPAERAIGGRRRRTGPEPGEDDDFSDQSWLRRR